MQLGLDMPRQMRVYAIFFIYAFAMGGIFPRIGDLQLQLGVSEGALGLALMGPSVGSLIVLTFGGGLVERIGYRRTLFFTIPAIAAISASASMAPTPLMVFFILIGMGMMIGASEIIINVEADRTEHAIGRRVMNRSHAFWSFGFFAAGLVGAQAKQLALSPQLHLWIVVLITAVAVLFVLGRYDPAPPRPAADDVPTPRFATPTPGILVLVAFTLSAMLLEGAGNDWSSIFMRDHWQTGPFINGFAVAIGALMQGIVRFYADGFVDRFGPEKVARTMVALLGAGCLLVVFGPQWWLAMIGFAMMGMGTSGIFPLAISAAAQRTDRASAINVAALAQLSFLAFLVGPPLLGFIAEHFGIVMAFAVGLPLVALSWFTIGALKAKPPVEPPARAPFTHV